MVNNSINNQCLCAPFQYINMTENKTNLSAVHYTYAVIYKNPKKGQTLQT